MKNGGKVEIQVLAVVALGILIIGHISGGDFQAVHPYVAAALVIIALYK